MQGKDHNIYDVGVDSLYEYVVEWYRPWVFQYFFYKENKKLSPHTLFCMKQTFV